MSDDVADVYGYVGVYDDEAVSGKSGGVYVDSGSVSDVVSVSGYCE